jgi:MFS family permease
MTAMQPDPYAALRHDAYRRYTVGMFVANVGRQMGGVAVAWQIYQWTHSATALGLVGLINVLPLLAFSLPAGLWADRFDRRRIIARTSAGIGCLTLLLAAVSAFHDWVPDLAPLRAGNAALAQVATVFERHTGSAALDFSRPVLPLIYLLLLGISLLRIVGWPARTSIVPLLLPSALLPNAVTWNSSAFEIATVAGPALGGFVIAWAGFPVVYLFDAASSLLLAGFVTRVTYANHPPPAVHRTSWRDTLAGLDFIRRRPVILGASLLDMFAVILGGATVLLPVFAEEILHVGPIGLGWLRAAPSVGAVAMAFWQAHRAPLARPGIALLWSVVGFGIATVVFGLSRSLWLSLVALFFTGAFDNISVVVRNSLVQILTPDALRGRVTSVNQIFIGSSNEIGSLRAGFMSALIGPVLAVTVGGAGTVLIAAAVALAVPALRRLPGLHTLRPET